MARPNGNQAATLTLPVDRRNRIKDAGDLYLTEVTNFKLLDGVEDEFLYEIPKSLKTLANNFEKQIRQWDRETRLSSSEICVVCGVFRKARAAADNRHFRDLADWLGVKEGRWKTKLHWRKNSYGTAMVLSFVDVTTGYGTSVGRWLMSIGVIIIGFAFLASNYLDYGGKHRSFGNSLYWSVVTMSTVGYGDIAPTDHPVGQILAGAEAVIGLVMFIGLGMLIGEKVRRP